MKKIKLTTILLLLFLISSCSLNSREKKCNSVEKKIINTDIPDLNLKKDLIYSNRFYLENNCISYLDSLKEGFYKSITDIFNGADYSIEYKKKLSGFYLEIVPETNKYNIYLVTKEEGILNENGDSTPFYSCTYYDGRYAILEDELDKHYTILDRKDMTELKIQYEDEDQISCIELYNFDYSIHIYIIYRDNNLSYFLSDKESYSQIKFNSNILKQIKGFENITSSSIRIMLENIKERKFNIVNTTEFIEFCKE